MNRINFKQERDLGTTLQDASAFIRGNFLKILKPTLIVVIAPLLLGTIVMTWSTKSMMESMSMANPNDPTQVFSNMAGMVPAYLLIMIAFVLVYIMYISYIKLYADGQEEIGLSDLMPYVKSKAVSLIVSSIVLIVVIYVGMILCFFPGVYLTIVFAHFFTIAIVEDLGLGGAWKRCFQLIRDEWWSCFGLYFVTYLISLGMAIIVYIPVYAILGIQMFDAGSQGDPEAMMESMSSLAYATPFYYLVGLVVAMLFCTVISLRYYSLIEKKDGSGEKEMIASI